MVPLAIFCGTWATPSPDKWQLRADVDFLPLISAACTSRIGNHHFPSILAPSELHKIHRHRALALPSDITKQLRGDVGCRRYSSQSAFPCCQCGSIGRPQNARESFQGIFAGGRQGAALKTPVRGLNRPRLRHQAGAGDAGRSLSTCAVMVMP